MQAGAKESAAAVLGDALDAGAGGGAGAHAAGLALAAIDLPGVLEVAELAAGLDVVAQRGAAGGDGLGEGGLDLAHEAGGTAADVPGGQVGREAGAVQGLAHVDVAEPGDDALIQQGGLERGAAALEGSEQQAGVERGGKRLRAEVGQQAMRVLGGRGHEVDAAEAAGVDEADVPAVVGLERDMLVQHGRVGAAQADVHAAGHAEMDQRAVAAIEAHQDVFGTAAETEDPGALEAGREARREGPAQVRPADLGMGDGPALEPGHEAAHHGFDFGEFRHGGASVYGAGMSDNTDFGFRTIPAADKKPMVRAVFDSVARRYDVMNDLMSLGVHRVWKRDFVAGLDPRSNRTLLDLAGGTGDIAFAWRARGGGPALLTDINDQMLAVARDRAAARGHLDGVTILVADAESLPIPDGSVDRVSMAFGLRNCTDKQAVLHEARRVLRPGGQFHCLEFSRVQVAALNAPYDAWSFQVLPRLGRMVAGDADSYRYLAESIRMFPDQETLADMMRAAGLSRVRHRNLTGGIAAIHVGWRL